VDTLLACAAPNFADCESIDGADRLSSPALYLLRIRQLVREHFS
jgi:hypothetical protein